MKTKCKMEGCNNPIWGNGLCVNHKSKKRIPTQNLTKSVKKEESIRNISEMRDFFLHIWGKRQHLSEVSGTSLGSEPLHVFFHHILSKEKYPEAKLDEENVVILTLWEHADVESDIYKYEEINNRRDKLKQKYEI